MEDWNYDNNGMDPGQYWLDLAQTEKLNNNNEAYTAALEQYGNWKQTMATQGWYENLSNTAHQREVADLKAAGLNPWLSASGTGASSNASSASATSGISSAITSKNDRLANIITTLTKTGLSAAASIMFALLML